MHTPFKKNSSKGFTIVEMMVSISIFLVVIVLGMTAILGMINANRKSQSSTLILSNLSLAIEAMSKSLRVAYTDTVDGTYRGGGNYIEFTPTTRDGGEGWIRYTFESASNSIVRTTSDDPTPRYITASEVEIDSMTFVPHNTGTSQPSVLILIKGHAGNKPGLESYFYVQSMVSQRLTPTL